MERDEFGLMVNMIDLEVLSAQPLVMPDRFDAVQSDPIHLRIPFITIRVQSIGLILEPAIFQQLLTLK